MNKPTLLKKIENEKRQQIIDLNQQLRQERERAERAERAYADLERSFASAARTMDADWRLHHLGWRRIAVTLASELEEEREVRERNKEAADTWMNVAEELKRERDEYRKALHSLLLEAECYAGMSKHLMRECEEARRILGGE